jgi:UDP-N-acetylglucosamine--N-acetylmuramyl-(pentapeptide) pyrophosphoryl-undecaprenol N-acetylglucosamine transferase
VKRYRYIISGGGTGGHIYPAIAIAQEIQRRNPEVEIMFVGARDRMEMQKVPKAGFPIRGLWISGFQRRLTLKNLWVPLKLLVSLLQSVFLIKSFRPNVVIGTGGYASGPLLRVAALFGIPTVIQEQNSFPGVTNKMLASGAKKICVAYQNMDRFFPREKIVYTGNPVRQDLLNSVIDRKDALAHFNMGNLPNQGDKFDHGPILLVLGGSLGAARINSMIAEKLDFFGAQNVRVIWQCGAYYYAQYRSLESPGARILPFIDQMAMAYAAADLIISRSGALSVSELALVGKPVLFIPSPNVAEDHQTKNAQALVNQNAAVMLKEEFLSSEFENTFLKLIKDQAYCEQLGMAIKSTAMPNATSEIVDQLNGLST